MVTQRAWLFKFLLVRDLVGWAHHKGRDDQDKLATWYEMFWRTRSPILEFCRVQKQVWMIELSYECDSMLHHVWLNIPYGFILPFFTQMISDRTTWRWYVRFTCWWELVVRWAGPFRTLSFVFAPSDEDTDNCMLFFHQPFLIFVDSWLTSWGPLEM